MPNALPVRRWQARQWQMETTNGSPSTSRRSCPQWQAAMRVTIRAILDTGGYAQALRAVSSAGRAPALQAGGRWFEPGTAHLIPPGALPGAQWDSPYRTALLNNATARQS